MVNAISYVGRVGALAVALGVGGVIAGLPPAAAEAPADSASGATQSGSDERAGATRARTRAGAADRGAATRNDQDQAPARGDRPARTTVRSGGPADEPSDGGSRRSPVSDPGPVTRDIPSVDQVEPAGVEIPTDIEIGAPSRPVAPETNAAPGVEVPRIALMVPPAAAQVPVMTAALPGAVSASRVGGLLDWLGGPGRTDIPGATPLVWAAAAVSRRELSPSRIVAPAASVTSGQLADQIAGLGLLAGLPQQLRDGIGQAAEDWLARALGTSAVAAVSDFVGRLGSDPSADDVIAEVGDAVSEWWAESGIEQRVRSLAEGVAGADVLTALADAAGLIAAAEDPGAALPEALGALLTDPAVRGAVDAAIAGVLDLAAEFGPRVSSVAATVTGAVSSWLDNPSLGDLAGPVTQLLSQPGVSAALAEAAGQFATALRGGADLGDAATGAWRSLQADPAIRAAVDLVVADAIGGLLTDAGVLSDLGDVVSGLVAGLAGDPALGGLAASVLTGFLGQPGVPNALADVAGEFAAALLAGTGLGDAAAGAWQSLRSNAALLSAVDLIVPTAFEGLLKNAEVLQYLGGAVSGLVTQFVGDAGVSARVADQIVPLMVSVLLDGPAAVDDFEGPITDLLRELIVGADPGLAELAPRLAAAGFALLRAGLVGDYSAVPATIGDLATDDAVLAALADRIAGIGALADLPAQIRVVIGDAAAFLVEETLGKPVVAEALTQVFAAISFPTDAAEVVALLEGLLQDGFDVETALAGLLGPEVPAALRDFLGNTDVLQTVGAAVAGALEQVVSGFATDADIRALVGDQIAAALAAVIGDGSAAAEIGAAVSGAVLGLLTESAIGDGLGAVAGAVLSGLLGQQAVADALADAAGEILTAVMSGTDPETALEAAFEALKADPAVVAALMDTLDTALDTLGTTLLGNAGVQEALGATVAALLTGLADDPAVLDVIGDLLGAGLGPTVVGLLADPEFGAATAGALGAAVTDLLGYPGVSEALINAVEQAVTALLDGTDPAVAVQALAADPAIRAALDAVLPGYLDAILDNSEVRDGLAEVAQQFVTDLLSDSGIDIPLVTSIAGRVTEAATASLLANAAFGELINDLAADVLGGTPVSEVTEVVVQAVLRDSELQSALGAAVGAGIGAILGDNLLGDVVGGVAGFVATVMIGLAAGLTLLFNPGILAAGAAATRTDGGYFDLFPAVPAITLTVAV